LEANEEISPVLQKGIDFVLASRWTLKSFCNCLCKPLNKKLTSLVIHGVQLNPGCYKNPGLVRTHETTAGPIFLLVRAMALNDSKVIKVEAPSR
jgi:hypothetical protein